MGEAVLLRPVEELEEILKMHEGPIDASMVKASGKAIAGMIQVYKEAAAQDSLDLFFRDFPITRLSGESWEENSGMFADIACLLNYKISKSNSHSAKARIFRRDKEGALAHLFNLIYTSRRISSPEFMQLQKDLPIIQQIGNAAVYGLDSWKKIVETSLEEAVAAAEEFVGGVFKYLGKDSDVEKMANAVFNVMKRGRLEDKPEGDESGKYGIEEELRNRISSGNVDAALNVLANYRDAAFAAYGSLGGNKEGILHAGSEMWEEVKKAREEHGKASVEISKINDEIRGLLKFHDSEAAKSGNDVDASKYKKQIEELKAKSEEAFGRAVSEAGKIYDNIFGYKRLIDKYVEEHGDLKRYKNRLIEVVELAFKKGVIAKENEVVSMLERAGIEKRAKTCIDAVRKTWPYILGSYNPKDIDGSAINYGLIKAINRREEYAGMLRRRAETILAQESGESAEGEISDDTTKAQEILDLIVPKSSRIKDGASNPEYLLKIEEMLRNAKDSKYMREFAYLGAEPSLKRFGKVVSDVESAMRAGWVNTDERREEERKAALQRSLSSRIGFLENGENPAAKPFESYSMLFPYADALFPAEKIGANGGPDILGELNVDVNGLKAKRQGSFSARHPYVGRVLSIFGLN